MPIKKYKEINLINKEGKIIKQFRYYITAKTMKSKLEKIYGKLKIERI